MHLVVNHMAELDHIDDTHGCRLVEVISGTSVPELGLSVTWQTRLVGKLVDFLNACTVKDRGAELDSELLSGPSENCFVNLAEVHS